MPSKFDAALAVADAAQLRTFGELCTFHDPGGILADAPIVVIFSERDTAEPPNSMAAARGQYTKGWTTAPSLPVEAPNPEGYQIVTNGVAYTVRGAIIDGSGGISMLLYKARE